MIIQPENKKRITNILVECPALIPSVKVGVLDVLHPLMEAGKCNIQYIPTLLIKAKHIKWCDILITVRGGEKATLEIVRVAKKYKRFVIYYLDDDLLNVPTENEEERLYYEQIVKRNLPQIIGLCDCLWGVNKNVREKYIKFCSTRRWVENKVPIRLLEIDNESKETVKVLFAGSTGHQGLFREVLSPVIRALAKEHGEKIDFTCIGIDSGIDGLVNVHNIEYFTDYNKYRVFVEKGNFDIGLAIVRDEPFYRCKYYNKFLEYTSIGCVGIYTETEPYTFVIKNGENGYLCKNTFTEWKQTIESVAFDSQKRFCCLAKAKKELQTNHNIESIVNDLIVTVPEFINYKASEVKGYHGFLFNPKWIYRKDRIRNLYINYGFYRGSKLIVCKILKKIIKRGTYEKSS